MARGRRVQHGHNRNGMPTRTYRIWQNMKARCFNPSNPKFKNYGAIGLSVCPEWLDFSKFLADMGEAPEGMSLERKDNSKGYCLDNCKWATAKEQAFNRRTTRQISYSGRTLCLDDWAKEFGIPRSTFQRKAKAVGYDLSLLQLTAKEEPSW